MKQKVASYRLIEKGVNLYLHLLDVVIDELQLGWRKTLFELIFVKYLIG